MTTADTKGIISHCFGAKHCLVWGDFGNFSQPLGFAVQAPLGFAVKAPLSFAVQQLSRICCATTSRFCRASTDNSFFPGAGTDSSVFATIFGKNGDSGERRLHPSLRRVDGKGTTFLAQQTTRSSQPAATQSDKQSTRGNAALQMCKSERSPVKLLATTPMQRQRRCHSSGVEWIHSCCVPSMSAKSIDWSFAMTGEATPAGKNSN